MTLILFSRAKSIFTPRTADCKSRGIRSLKGINHERIHARKGLINRATKAARRAVIRNIFAGLPIPETFDFVKSHKVTKSQRRKRELSKELGWLTYQFARRVVALSREGNKFPFCESGVLQTGYRFELSLSLGVNFAQNRRAHNGPSVIF